MPREIDGDDGPVRQASQPQKPKPKSAGRDNPLIPLASLYNWKPDAAAIEACLASDRPEGMKDAHA